MKDLQLTIWVRTRDEEESGENLVRDIDSVLAKAVDQGHGSLTYVSATDVRNPATRFGIHSSH